MKADDRRLGRRQAQDLVDRRFSGPVVVPGDADYDEVRRVHNGLVDKRPGLIARCRHATDIIAAVDFAVAAGLEISVRGGGHN